MMDSPVDSRLPAVSVIIATLGGPTLKGTVETLNRGSLIPAEILICIPLPEASRGIDCLFPNVRILQTSCRGQVAQRAEGFRQAANLYVMQLDDDISVDHACVERLARTLQKFPDAAVSPTLINSLTNESVYRTDHGNGVFRRIYRWLMNGRDGYREGSILRSGSPIGVVPGRSAGEWQEVEWLAGGCVMHHKANLILENYFPFAGKAFCEDIIHSHLLRQKGVRLLIDSRARCSLDVSSPLHRNWDAFLQETYDDFIVRRYYMRLSKRAPGRMYLYYFLLIFRYLYLWLARKAGRGSALPAGASRGSKQRSE